MYLTLTTKSVAKPYVIRCLKPQQRLDKPASYKVWTYCMCSLLKDLFFLDKKHWLTIPETSISHVLIIYLGIFASLARFSLFIHNFIDSLKLLWF